MIKAEKKKTGLALSGGGVRAASFHAGVLLYLAEKNQIESIKHISSVSGGSLFTGLVFSINNNKWPTSKIYMESVFPEIKKKFTTTSIQTQTILKLASNPLNWRFFFSRANVVAAIIEEKWGVKTELKDLPRTPVWSINGTTGENGKRFRFKGCEAGDYELGYTNIPGYKLANAMAMSAAFPFGIGPVTLKTGKLEWRKKKDWSSREYIKNYKIPYRKLHLYDGGVYDNLGLEPLFDTGKQKLKDPAKIDLIIVSDASSLLQNESIPFVLNPSRALRIVNMILSQVRSLRVRSFADYLIKNRNSGFYFLIGTHPVQSIQEYKKNNSNIAKHLLNYNWLDKADVEMAAGYKTTLKKMTEREFDIISRHGYETAKWNIELYGKAF